MGAPAWSPLPGLRQSPPVVAARAQSSRSGGRGRCGGRGRDVGARGEVERDRGKDDGQGGVTGADQVVDSGEVSAARFPRRSHHIGSVLAGGGPDTKSGRGIPWHRTCGGDLEGSDSDSQSPLHRRHHLPRLPPRVPGGSRYRYCRPRCQAAPAGYVLEVGGTQCDIPGPAQCLQCFG